MENKNINLTLVELIIGIIAYGIVAQGILVAIAAKVLGKTIYYSLGLWIGIVLAVMLALHMNRTIEKAIEAGEAGAEKTVKVGAILRYVVICVLMFIVAFADISNPVMVFVGCMGLKVGAYVQPITHGILRKCGPSKIREYIKLDDVRRQELLREYEEEQKKLEEERLSKEKIDKENIEGKDGN